MFLGGSGWFWVASRCFLAISVSFMGDSGWFLGVSWLFLCVSGWFRVVAGCFLAISGWFWMFLGVCGWFRGVSWLFLSLFWVIPGGFWVFPGYYFCVFLGGFGWFWMFLGGSCLFLALFWVFRWFLDVSRCFLLVSGWFLGVSRCYFRVFLGSFLGFQGFLGQILKGWFRSKPFRPKPFLGPEPLTIFINPKLTGGPVCPPWDAPAQPIYRHLAGPQQPRRLCTNTGKPQ